MKRFGSEMQLAEGVVAWLRAQDWHVYQEVEHRGSRADIVATRGPLLWVVECKLSFGLDVLGQAWHWKRVAHLVSVATASAGGSAGFGQRLLQDYGIGYLRVSQDYDNRATVVQEEQPELFRRANDSGIRKRLTPELEAYGAKAGNCGSDYYSPYKQTCLAVLRFVLLNPGCTLRQLVDGIADSHHYMSKASARSSLMHWIRAGKVPGVRLVKDGKAATVVLAPAEEKVA